MPKKHELIDYEFRADGSIVKYYEGFSVIKPANFFNAWEEKQVLKDLLALPESSLTPREKELFAKISVERKVRDAAKQK